MKNTIAALALVTSLGACQVLSGSGADIEDVMAGVASQGAQIASLTDSSLELKKQIATLAADFKAGNLTETEFEAESAVLLGELSSTMSSLQDVTGGIGQAILESADKPDGETTDWNVIIGGLGALVVGLGGTYLKSKGDAKKELHAERDVSRASQGLQPAKK